MPEPEVGRGDDPLVPQFVAVLDEQARVLERNCARTDTIAEQGQPVFGYICGFERVEGGVRTFLTPDNWTWSKDLGEGYRISFNPGGSLPRTFGTNLLPDFSGRSPLMWIEGPNGGSDRNFGRNRVWQYRVAVEVRVGHRAIRQWASSNVLGVIEWSAWPQLLSEPGDIAITVYDSELGVLNRSVLPRNVFEQIETRVGADITQLVAVQKDPVRKCELRRTWEGGPDIVVT